MQIHYESKTYQFDMDDLDVEQALKIEQHIGGPMIEWEKGMITGAAKCVQVLGWLVLYDGALDVPITSVNFKYTKLAAAFQTAAEKEAKTDAGKTADPTPGVAGNGRTSARVSSPSP